MPYHFYYGYIGIHRAQGNNFYIGLPYSDPVAAAWPSISGELCGSNSSDGLKFVKIGTVSAVNQIGIHTYTLNDAQPLEGKNFYRLKQVDKDSKYEWSKTVLVNRSKAINIHVFPNPAQNFITVVVPLQTAVQTIWLMDAKANMLKWFTVAAGNGSIDIPLTALSAGQYFIKWENGNEVQVKPFLKL